MAVCSKWSKPKKTEGRGEYCKTSQCRPFHPRSSPTKAEANTALAPSGAWRTDRLWFSTGSSCLPRLATVCSSQRISIRPTSIRPRWTANKRPSRRGIWTVSYGSLSSVHPLSHLRPSAAGATACASGSGSFEDITSPIERPRRISRFVFNEVSVRPHAPMRIHAHGKRTRPCRRKSIRTSPEIATFSTGAQGCFEDVSEDELQQMRRGTRSTPSSTHMTPASALNVPRSEHSRDPVLRVPHYECSENPIAKVSTRRTPVRVPPHSTQRTPTCVLRG